MSTGVTFWLTWLACMACIGVFVVLFRRKVQREHEQAMAELAKKADPRVMRIICRHCGATPICLTVEPIVANDPEFGHLLVCSSCRMANP